MPDKTYSNDGYEIGGKIRDERKKRKLSQHKLGEKMGISGNTISRYEIGEHVMNVETYFAFADALEVDPDALAPDRFAEKSANNKTDPEGQQETELLNLFANMDSSDREMLLAFARRMAGCAAATL